MTINWKPWIIGAATENVLAPFSMGMERLIKAKYLLKKGNYYEFLAWLSQSEELFRRYNMWLILLDILIYKSIAFHYVHDEEQSIAALCEAYEIAHGNNLITQFAEHGNDIRLVVYRAKYSEQNTIPDAWLDEIYTKAATYEKHLRSMKVQHHQTSGQPLKPLVKVTKREKEMPVISTRYWNMVHGAKPEDAGFIHTATTLSLFGNGFQSLKLPKFPQYSGKQLTDLDGVFR